MNVEQAITTLTRHDHAARTLAARFALHLCQEYNWSVGRCNDLAAREAAVTLAQVRAELADVPELAAQFDAIVTEWCPALCCGEAPAYPLS